MFPGPIIRHRKQKKFQLSILGVIGGKQNLEKRQSSSHLSQGTRASLNCIRKGLDRTVMKVSSVSLLAFGLT